MALAQEAFKDNAHQRRKNKIIFRAQTPANDKLCGSDKVTYQNMLKRIMPCGSHLRLSDDTQSPYNQEEPYEDIEYGGLCYLLLVTVAERHDEQLGG